MAKKWIEKEVEFLKTNFQKMSNEALAKKFGVSESSIRMKVSRLGLKRKKSAKAQKIKPSPATARAKGKPKTKKKAVTRDTVHENIRCRSCLIVDGYTQEDGTCKHCGAKLFKGDVL